MKKRLKHILTTIKFLLSFPVFWVAIAILILSIASLIVSKSYDNANNSFESSMYNNIFTGLLTGLVLAVLSGLKTLYVSYKEARLLWLEETHKMILDHLSKERELWSSSKSTDEEFYNTAYDALCAANWVNDRIMQSTFDKVKWFDPPKYFNKNYGYDCLKTSEELYELREFIIHNGDNNQMRKEVINKIRDASHIMMTLNHNILTDIDSLKIKITYAKKSII